ncbi:MAG TPA: PHP domain-containing protein, partial [Pyrinomonadaceae bacterium]|nr:PHP domain-containing protein [Pyrinomonadaceae bacterium]
IGDALASQIKQLYLTGESSVLNQLRQEFPSGVLELMTVPGLSLTKIKQLHDEVGINSIADLKAAAKEGRLRNLKGFGAKTEQTLLTVAQQERKRPTQRLYMHHALNTGERVVQYLQTLAGLVEVSFAGSLRRQKETVGTIEIVASAKDPAGLVQQFLKFPLIASSSGVEADACLVQLADGALISLTAVTPAEFASTLFVKTGSPAHVEKVRQYAVSKRVNLPFANGSKPGKKTRLPRSEEEIYQRLDMQSVPPELREDAGEVEAAIVGKLPTSLLQLDDIKGMVHCHTTYSDGKHGLEDMVRAAESMGMKYITITDHSPTAFYAGGLTIDRLRRQWDEIDEVQEKVKIKILRGTESDIVADGGLDYPDRILEQLDVIVASIHSRYKMDAKKMTERIVTAMRQPVFKIWGHALGRLIQRRPPIECDVERILDVIAESKAAIEINGDPYRLDLEPNWVREARKRKIKFVISVDAHSMGALANVRYGVAMARRGWVEKKEVLNTLPPSGFMKAVKPTASS